MKQSGNKHKSEEEETKMGRIFCILTGYLCGSFLTAELVAQERIGKSAFEIGTGNPGMANLAEQGGVGCAFRVLAGDVGKTLLACLLCRYVCGAELGTLAAAYAGLGCILGHDYPFWHWFHGGKGVACNAAALILIWPMGGLFSCLIGLTAVLLTGYLPLGAVLIPAAFILPAFLEYGPESGFLTVLMTFIMLRQHSPGLKNMFLGTEKKVDLPGMLR